MHKDACTWEKVDGKLHEDACKSHEGFCKRHFDDLKPPSGRRLSDSGPTTSNIIGRPPGIGKNSIFIEWQGNMPSEIC
jgi:hypothetical protein